MVFNEIISLHLNFNLLITIILGLRDNDPEILSRGDNTELKGLYEIQPKIFGDSRGYFIENYSERDFFAAGLTMKFVQDNRSKSSKGVLRGLHFQTQHPQ